MILSTQVYHMDNEAAIGIAPLITGLALLGTTDPGLLTVAPTTSWTSTEFLYSLTGTIGGAAAVFVGCGILLGWKGFEASEGSAGTANTAVVVAAVVAFCAGWVLTAV